MQRLLDLTGNEPVGGYSHEHIGCLEADLEVLEIMTVQHFYMAHSRFNQCRWGRFAVLSLQRFFQRTRVYPDTNRDTTILRSRNHSGNTVFPANVTGIDPKAVDTVLCNLQRNF